MNEQPWSTNPNYENSQINDCYNILHCIVFPSIYSKVLDLKVSFALSEEPVPFVRKNKLKYKPLKVGQSWSHKIFQCAWFHLEGKLDPSLSRKNLYLTFDCNGEALLYSATGLPLKGFTNGSSEFDRGLAEPTKRHYPLDELIAKDGSIDLYLDAGSNDLFGRLQMNDTLLLAEVDRKDLIREARAYDYEVLLDLLQHLDSSSPIFKPLFAGLIALRNLYWYHDKDADNKALLIISNLYKLDVHDDYKVIAVGHSHLDLAWLWPLRESHRKIMRTMSNVFYLLKKYPFFTFVLSQPRQMEWLKEEAPSLFEELKKYEKEGRIELVGGEYVESDTNLVGEEAFARQMLYGQKFYLENFGHYTSIGWLPDTFGYNGSLPQIFALSKQPYFVTTKMSWNTVNQFPYHSFIWEGVDGSKILAHIPPEGTYNSGAYPRSILTMEKNTKPCDGLKEGLMVYGVGDGGAGPSVGHLERLAREGKTTLMPKVSSGHAMDVFKDLEPLKDSLPVQKGEMYLENHQGTYTSQSNNKQWNRHMEEKLVSHELLFTMLSAKKSQKQLDKIWQEVLLYQFHDILPGSSIKRVYDESEKRYKILDKEVDAITKVVAPSVHSIYKAKDYVFNPLSVNSSLLLKSADGYSEGTISPFNSMRLTLHKGEKIAMPKVYKCGDYEVAFNSDGSLKSVLNVVSHQEFLSGDSNHLRVYLDHGDAWNIMDSYREQTEVYMKLTSQVATIYGNLLEVKNSYRFLHSALEETMVLDLEHSLIRFHHDLSWDDTGYMLKSCWSLTNHSETNRFDIPYGALSRSALNVSSREKAQFEVPFYKWADVSSKNSGTSFIAKAKDGCYAKGEKFELTLLRSTNYPCVHSDQKLTSYDYEVYFHDDAFKEKETDELANVFNASYLYSSKPLMANLVGVSDDDINITSIKLPYSLKGGYFVRLHERGGVKKAITLTGLKEHQKVTLMDLLEDPLEEVDTSLSFHPYEVKTLWIH